FHLQTDRVLVCMRRKPVIPPVPPGKVGAASQNQLRPRLTSEIFRQDQPYPSQSSSDQIDASFTQSPLRLRFLDRRQFFKYLNPPPATSISDNSIRASG